MSKIVAFKKKSILPTPNNLKIVLMFGIIFQTVLKSLVCQGISFSYRSILIQ